MNVKMDIDSTRLQANLRKLQKSIPAKVKRTLMQTAQFGTTIILDRTEKGIGYSGRFKPYDAKYRAYKRQGWPSSKPAPERTVLRLVATVAGRLT